MYQNETLHNDLAVVSLRNSEMYRKDI